MDCHASSFTFLLSFGVLFACGNDVGIEDGGTDSGALPDAFVDSVSDDGGIDARLDDVPLLECPPPPVCNAAPPTYEAESSWRHSVRSRATTLLGGARHRGRDLVLRLTDEQWVIGKFAYGGSDKDLEDEDVDIYVLRECGDSWEMLGTATTTEDGDDHPTVERIEDDGGRVFFQIPEGARLGVGRHRIHLVVNGDHSSADMYIDVVDGARPYIVSDVDGTLTESETAEWTALLGATIGFRPSSPEALTAAVSRGYRIFYVTARPDWLTTRSHEWLAENGYPLGLVHTTNNGLGALGGAALTFKTDELNELGERIGGPPAFAIGNSASDAETYEVTGVDAAGRYLYAYDGDLFGGMAFDDYADLVALFSAAPLVCR